MIELHLYYFYWLSMAVERLCVNPRGQRHRSVQISSFLLALGAAIIFITTALANARGAFHRTLKLDVAQGKIHPPTVREEAQLKNLTSQKRTMEPE